MLSKKEEYLKLVNEVSIVVNAETDDSYSYNEYKKMKDKFLEFFNPIEEETRKERKQLFKAQKLIKEEVEEAVLD
jgi:UDP-N-acetylmuramate-alanine ligase